MEKGYDIIAQRRNNYTVRQETFDGAAHIVVPVVMMVEGVHSGSQGPILHTAEQLGRVVEAWNGIPVVIGHPRNSTGFISANSPNVPNVGRIFNTRFENGKLRAECYINISKITNQSPTALAHIRNQRPLQVSVGTFSDTDSASGIWNSEQYVAVARNYRPDHLALLPGEEGACSWNDGCGIRTNSKQKNNMEKEITIVANSLSDRKNEFTEIVNKVRSIVDSMDNGVYVNFLREVYDDGFIYETRKRESNQSQYYTQKYSIREDGGVELMDNPVPVRQEINYIAQSEQESSEPKTKVNNNKKSKGENKMSKTKCTVAKVNALIANESTNFTEDHREWLESQTDEMLSALEPLQVNRTTPPVVAKQVVTDEEVTAYLDGKSQEDVLKLLPAKIQANVSAGLQMREEMRTKMVEEIMAYENTPWEKEELIAMSCDQLRKIHAMGTGTKETPVADYSLAGGAGKVSEKEKKQVQVNAAAEEVMLPAGLGMKKESK